MKKITALVAAMLAAMVLMGCGDSGQATKEEVKAPEQAATEQAQPAAPAEAAKPAEEAKPAQ